jgi:hypothetical protein
VSDDELGNRIGPIDGQTTEAFERQVAIVTAGMYEQVGRLVHHLGMYEMTLLALVHNLTIEKVLREMARVMQVEKRTNLVKDLLEDRGFADFHSEFETLAKRAGKLFDERAICTHNLVTAVWLMNHNPDKGASGLFGRLPAKQLHEISGALVRRQESDDDLL